MLCGREKIWRLLFSIVAAGIMATAHKEEIRRSDFPKDFVFGAGTSAYQVEGAASEDGRTPSVWDTYARAGFVPGTGDIAADEYHNYKEDVKLMKETGLEAYRFSISWSRLIPNGRGDVNPKGLEYYNNLINELISNGIQPHVTLFHYDLPQILEDEYEGWLSTKAVDDFTAFADVCFREFGNRVRFWTTFNEPNAVVMTGYDLGLFPPSRCSYPFGTVNCTRGNSILEPYIAGHNLLLAHASAVSLYRRRYQAIQHGSIGLNLIIFNWIPETDSEEDLLALLRAQDFYLGWFLKPITYGDYPESMKENAGSKLPKFSSEQYEQLIGSFDFIGLNYYASLTVKYSPNDKLPRERDCMGDMMVAVPAQDPVVLVNGSTYLNTTSGEGLRLVLEYLKDVYNNPPTYIHENGFISAHDGSLNDTDRVAFLSVHIKSLHDAIKNGSNTKGYFVWSFLDLYEAFGGYAYSYGLYYVDFASSERKRYPKLSARLYANFLKGEDIAQWSGNEKVHALPSSISTI